MLLSILAFLPGFGSGERLFAPDADLWDRWTRHDAASTARIDHGAWDALLQRHVEVSAPGANRVTYDRFGAEDLVQLERYVTQMASVEIGTFNRDEQLAYWINLYNALTVQVVLNNLPVKSIRDIDTSPGLFSSGPWGQEVIAVEGNSLTLNDIEHRILRPVWQDPRIHYAVNCASIGCPDLAPNAYTGGSVQAMLETAAKAYVNDQRGVRVTDGKVTVSRIYDWFIEDFGGTEQGVMAHLLRYADAGLAVQLRAAGGITDTQYDWSLNGG